MVEKSLFELEKYHTYYRTMKDIIGGSVIPPKDAEGGNYFKGIEEWI